MDHSDVHGDITVWYEDDPDGPRPVGYSDAAEGTGCIHDYGYPYE